MSEKITKLLSEAARTAGTGNVKNAIGHLINAVKEIRDETLKPAASEIADLLYSTNKGSPISDTVEKKSEIISIKAYFPEIDDENDPDAYLDRYVARKLNLKALEDKIESLERKVETLEKEKQEVSKPKPGPKPKMTFKPKTETK